MCGAVGLRDHLKMEVVLLEVLREAPRGEMGSGGGKGEGNMRGGEGRGEG